MTTGNDYSAFFAAAECGLDDFYIFDGIFDASGTIVDFRFRYINPAAEARLGVPREALYGKVLTEVRPFMVRSGLIDEYREVVRTGDPYTCEVYIDDDMIRDTWLNVQVIRIGTGISITSRDVTEHRRRADHVHHLAHHDHLTGLANRMLLHKRLEQAIAQARAHDQIVAVFLVDVDYFKQINDAYGHAFGDALLAAVGQRLLASVRQSDTVARLGGDEFVVIMPDIESIQDVERCGEQILSIVSSPIEIAGRSMTLTISIGASTFPDGGRTVEEILINADRAMYSVKDSGRNSLRIFDGGLEAETRMVAPAQHMTSRNLSFRCPSGGASRQRKSSGDSGAARGNRV
jgi:diguanylate cyclase (GGDEF)-like protein